jgi:cephalosporin hydroxylase
MKQEPRYKLPPLQDEREFAAFIDLLIQENVRSYLEIGAMYGASLWKVATSLPKFSRIVAIDAMVDRPEARESLEHCIDELKSLGYDAHFIFGDSTEPRTIESAKFLGPFDALFIDGNHSPEYVLADWMNYGPMARIVGFHDINWNDTWISARGNTPDETLMGAPRIWDQVKRGRLFKEFKFYPRQNYYGIGVIFQ